VSLDKCKGQCYSCIIAHPDADEIYRNGWMYQINKGFDPRYCIQFKDMICIYFNKKLGELKRIRDEG